MNLNDYYVFYTEYTRNIKYIIFASLFKMKKNKEYVK